MRMRKLWAGVDRMYLGWIVALIIASGVAYLPFRFFYPIQANIASYQEAAIVPAALSILATVVVFEVVLLMGGMWAVRKAFKTDKLYQTTTMVWLAVLIVLTPFVVWVGWEYLVINVLAILTLWLLIVPFAARFLALYAVEPAHAAKPTKPLRQSATKKKPIKKKRA